MKLGIFTTITNPVARGDCIDAALACYTSLADEVVVIDGSNWTDDKKEEIREQTRNSNVKTVFSLWRHEFSWEFIGQQFQLGYENCEADWVIHCDIDFIFHEKDFDAIRQACIDNPDAPALSFWKYQFIQPDRYNLKSRLVIAVNKGKYGDRIKFNAGGDLCQPSLDGEEIKPSDVPEARIAFYNYEKLFKTKDQIMDDVGRMARAWERCFGEYKLGGWSDESAFEEWLIMVRGRYSKPQTMFNGEHPKFIKPFIENLNKDQWGSGGLGCLE